MKTKYKKLINYFNTIHRCVIAFSGGKDSSFLLAVAHKILGRNVLAITIKTPYIPQWEVDEAVQFTKQLGIQHKIISLKIPKDIINNSEARCYVCKKILFKKIIAESKKHHISVICDGSNSDDMNDFRPGLKAIKELNIQSPLRQFNITKNDITLFSKRLKLPTWNKPPYACLLTRIPYNTPITMSILQQIEKAETYIMQLGFKSVRVRHHDNIARIEVGSDERKKFFNEALLNEIAKTLKSIGYTYVTFDLEGYKTGNMNIKTTKL